MKLIKSVTIGDNTFQIVGDSTDHYFTSVTDDPQPRLAEAMRRARKGPGTVWLDIGANCGLTVLPMAADNSLGKVVGYEPHPSVFANLNQAVALNGRTNVSVANAALGATPGVLTLYPGGPINFSRSSGSHVWTNDHWMPRDRCVDVTLSTLDIERRKNGWGDVSLIKIDVEGFEKAVLEGAQELLAASRPLVFLEFNSWCLIALVNKTPRDFLTYLRKQFANVYAFADDGALQLLQSPGDDIAFLHRNLTQRGCVDDLLCASAALV